MHAFTIHHNCKFDTPRFEEGKRRYAVATTAKAPGFATTQILLVFADEAIDVRSLGSRGPRCAANLQNRPKRNSINLIACRISGIRDGDECNRGWSNTERTGWRSHRGKLRKIIWTGLQNCSIQLHDATLKMVCRQRVALAGHGHSQGGGGRPVDID